NLGSRIEGQPALDAEAVSRDGAGERNPVERAPPEKRIRNCVKLGASCGGQRSALERAAAHEVPRSRGRVKGEDRAGVGEPAGELDAIVDGAVPRDGSEPRPREGATQTQRGAGRGASDHFPGVAPGAVEPQRAAVRVELAACSTGPDLGR